jgi:hypothetical protein
MTPGRSIIRADVTGTAFFVVTMAIAIPLRDRRPAQVAVIAVSMALFAVGIVTALIAYSAALERSRAQQVGVANVFLLTGATAPPAVKRAMNGLLAAQVVVAISGATAGVVGLDKGELNALAFGVLVPMAGIGLNGLWGARHGTYGPRADPVVQPSNRKIG